MAGAMGDYKHSSSTGWYCRRVLQRDGLRRRYLALLVPALAKVHAAYAAGGQEQQLAARARAVRRAADACLMQAISHIKPQNQQIGLHVRAARRTCSMSSRGLHRSAISYRMLRKAKAKYGKSSCSPARLQRCSSTRIAAGDAAAADINSRRSSIREDRKLAECAAPERAPADRCWEPDESELRRLQNVLFPSTACSNSSSTSTNRAAEEDDDVHSILPTADPCSSRSSNINPAALLNHAALYIIALQVQVDALRSLANIT